MNPIALEQIIKQALLEDIGAGDLTGEAIFSEGHQSTGRLIAKQPLILAGTEVFRKVFQQLDNRIELVWNCREGDSAAPGTVLASLRGPTRALLAGERVALNFLQHLTGIATATKDYVRLCSGTGTMIVDTRKTIPGLRMLEKYAVTVGGGKNHRYALDAMVMIKDNHSKAAGGILPAVQAVRRRISPFIKIEVEVECLEQVKEALTAAADVIMLDNMDLDTVKQAVALIDGRALIEVSGNITEERVAALAGAGVDVISSGALTHSVRAADISLKFE